MSKTCDGFGRSLQAENDLPSLFVPPAWRQLRVERLTGIVMVIGAPDTGKSTFARYLFGRVAAGRLAAFLDGDPGQSTLGPPTTISVQLNTAAGEDAFPPQGALMRWFVGSVSPRGHMLPLIVGVRRLAEAALTRRAEIIVCDTTGLVDRAQGGMALKLAKIDLLRPRLVFAFQRERELAPLLAPLVRSGRVNVISLEPAVEVRPRDPQTRRAYRAAQFRRYFGSAPVVSLSWARLAVFPRPVFAAGQLLALEDARGFTLGLGTICRYQREERILEVRTPLASLADVTTLHLSSRRLNPDTYEDEPLIRRTAPDFPRR